VRLDEPAWWYGAGSSRVAAVLAPLGALYGRVARFRYGRVTPYRSRLPVLCAGNFTAGGTGKTPLALYLCGRLEAAGRRPFVLTRGYGGRHAGPRWVEAGDTASDVGDEALLLARVAPTLVARDRAAGARAIEARGDAAGAIVMDDGLQNPQLAKDLSIAVVDGRRGVGNGRVIPAGPLRAPLAFQLGLTDAIVVNAASGVGDAVAGWLRQRSRAPVLHAATVAAGDTGWLEAQRVVAFAGIGAPERFFAMLERLGAELVERIAFRDHERLGQSDAAWLLGLARRHQAALVSTEKDLARLEGADGALGELAVSTRALPVRLSFAEADAERLGALVDSALKRRRG
jgi:tetraacyldisaccharide 4'-kinase